MKKLLLPILVCIYGSSWAQRSTNNYPITPKPQQLIAKEGSFILSDKTVIVMNDASQVSSINFLNNYLFQLYGFKLRTVKSATKNFIQFAAKPLLPEQSVGSYQLNISPLSIQIIASSHAGTFYGVQSILQLLPPSTSQQLMIACAVIKDAPRFQYRGLHLDVSRHFFSVDFIKKYLDYMAYYKLNTFHWHLTDDQGWRIEIKKYPLLTSVGSVRQGTLIGRYPGTGNDNEVSGGFYTQSQIKEVVAYAAKRYINVVPEIEMPGHSSAAIAAYPQLSCFANETTKIPTAASESSQKMQGKKVQETWGVFEDVFAPTPYTFTFLQNVLDEVMALFPSTYIHIGGDECPKASWKRSAFCQQLIKDNGLQDERGLQSYFIQRIEKYINKKGRKIIGWDEILEGGLAPNATVMSWQGEQGGIVAAKQGHDVVMTPGTYCYLDHKQQKKEDSITIGGYLPIDTVYSYNPVPAILSAKEAAHILGAQANVWTEYMSNPSKVEYMIFPRLAAFSEVLWTQVANKNWEDFATRLPHIFNQLDFWKTNYCRPILPINTSK